MLLLVCGGAGAEPATKPQPQPTRLEETYSTRAGEELRQYGYTLFEQDGTRMEPGLGTIADGHVLGPGDSLSVTLRGQTSSRGSHIVGTDGLVILDGLRPIMAAGRTLGDVRREVEAEVAAALFDTTAYVTLTSARRLSVLVLGEVRRPGRHDLSAFATVLDALFVAGGVAKSGSLRDIRLVQPGAADYVPVDLYDLLHTGGGAADHRLVDGARIIVPPLGPALAVAGQVQRPGIFELPPGESSRTPAELLAIAGGPLRPGPSALRLSTITQDGSEQVIALDPDDPAALDHGDILMLAPARADRRLTVSLLGHVHAPGPRALAAGTGIDQILADNAARDDAYLPFAVLVGLDQASGARRLTPVNLAAGEGTPKPPLADGDSLVLFGPAEIAFLSSRAVLRLLAGGMLPDPVPDATPQDEAKCPGLAALAARIAADKAGAFAAGPMAMAAADLIGPDLACPALFIDQPDLLPMALDHAVLLREGALRPGFYPAGPGAGTADLLAAAGGATGVHLSASAGQGVPDIIDAGEAWVELTGAVRDPGRVPLNRAGTLRALLAGGKTLSDDAYGLFAVLERVERGRGTRTLIPFAPMNVVDGGFDRRLTDRDRVTILSRQEVRTLLEPTAGPEGGSPPAAVGPATIGPATVGPPASDGTAPGTTLKALPPTPTQQETMTDATLLRLLTNGIVGLHGAVAEPGSYPVATDTTLSALIATAGGLLAQADPESLELVAGDHDAEQPVRLVRLSSPLAATLAVRPGDAVRVPRRAPPPQRGGIVLAGEVRDPGRYDLIPGETLSSVLSRAGGLLPTAYPEGAIFTRDSARQAERQGLLRAAEEMERSLGMMMLRPDPPDAAQVESARRLVGELRTVRAVGRLTVEADPAVLAARPELDIVLEPGDRLYLPKRPLTVTVSGEVLSPAALQFVPGKRGRTYLMEAGGLTRHADEDRIFVLLPDGSARPLSQAERHGVEAVPPGSNIIVPRDPEPYEFLSIAQSVTTILGQLALTAVAVTSLDD